MSISSIGGGASQVWHHRESKAQQASSTNGAGGAQGPRRESFPGLPPDAGSSPEGASKSTGMGTGGSNGISRPASKLIADVNSLLISLQAGNTATGAAPAAGTGAASGNGTASAAGSSTASSSPAGGLSQDQLAGLSTVLDDLGKVHGGGHNHHGRGAPASGSQPAAADGTSAAAIPGAGGASPAQQASGSSPSDLLTQLAKALSAYGTGQASATSQPGTVVAA